MFLKLFLGYVSCIAVILSVFLTVGESTTPRFHNETKVEDVCVAVQLLNIAEKLIKEAKEYENFMKKSDTLPYDDKPMDCAEILEKSKKKTKSGMHRIWPRNRVSKGFIDVYCDMDDEGGGWTVLQRRGDFDSSKLYFYRDWKAYRAGFGDMSKEFWLGNDNIFALTNERENSVKFVLTDWEGNKTYATYDTFWIDAEYYNYTMHVEGYRGTAGDSFGGTNGAPFTTKDRDNDRYKDNCAVTFKGAWWYTSCHSSNLNGQYLKGEHETYADGVEWSGFRGQHYSLKDTVIKIRPKNFINFSLSITPQ